jgi:hypothetical protein
MFSFYHNFKNIILYPASDSHIIMGSHTLKCTPPSALSITGCLLFSTSCQTTDNHDHPSNAQACKSGNNI